MKSIGKVIVLIGICVFLGIGWSWSRSLQAKATIKAIDDDGNPIVGMPVIAGFYSGDISKGVTDTNGMFVAKVKANCGKMGFALLEKGFYDTRKECIFTNYLDHHCLPWNPVVTTIVRRIINPIPMVAKKVGTKINKLPQSFAYDLLVGDWVNPEGKGIVSDFVFKVDGFAEGQYKYHAVLSLSFQSNSDGVVPFTYPNRRGYDDMPMGSSLIIPHQAPETGYVSSNQWQVSCIKSQNTSDYYKTNDCYRPIVFRFRIRSSTNELGIVTNAYYGQLRKINFFPSGTFYPNGEKCEGHLSFTYYLNPTPNDRNLEFDPKQNLY